MKKLLYPFVRAFEFFCGRPDDCVINGVFACVALCILAVCFMQPKPLTSNKNDAMISFGDTMDPHSLEIRRDGKRVGQIHWHNFREDSRKIELHSEEDQRFNQSELEQILQRMQTIRSNGGNKYSSR